MEFRFDVSYTKQDLAVFNRLAFRKYFPVRTLLIRAFFFVVGLLLIFAGTIWLVFTDDHRLAGLFNLLYGFFCLALCIFYFRFCAWQSSRLLIKNTAQSVVTFDEDGFQVRSSEVNTYYHYSGLIACYYYEGRYFLLQDKRHATILPESAMTGGNPEQFREFIAQKTGKEVEFVK